MAYYDALIQKWSTLTGATDEKIAAINAEMVDGPMQDVTVSAITGYLALNLKLAPLIDYAEHPPSGAVPSSLIAARNLVAVFRLPQPPAFGTSNSAIYAALGAALDAIIADPLSGLTQADGVALMALADTSVNWWRANGYSSPVGHSDLEAAGGLK